MNPGVVSGVVTALLFCCFIAGWRWAWSAARRDTFAAAARMPLDDGEGVRR